MKRTFALILAVVMLLGMVPVAAYAANPAPQNLAVTNAVDGYCGATVKLSWQVPSSVSDYSHGLIIQKSYNGSSFTTLLNKTNNVRATTSYTYDCVYADCGKKVYFRVAYCYSGSSTPFTENQTVSVNIRSDAVEDPAAEAARVEENRVKLLQGLADPTARKSTDKYDTYKFVVGTKGVWECKLYKLTATATKVSGSKVTFKVDFESKIPYKYLQSDGWHTYNIKLVANGLSSTFQPGDTMQCVVDTSKSDGLPTSSPTGMQFFKIEVMKNESRSIKIEESESAYREGIIKNREATFSGNYMQTFSIDDTYALSYYVSPGYSLIRNNYRITKNSITLGTYSFPSIVKYRVKGTSAWKQKAFASGKKMVLTGLKAATTYQIYPLCKIYFTDPETGEKKYTIDQVCNSFYLTTSITTKPVVSSVKISGLKYGKKTIPGYWESDGDWHPTETLNTVTYTMTVKVKKVPKAAKGLYVKIGSSTYYKTGNKTTYTFKMTYQGRGNLKGKSMKAYIYYASNTIGKSPLGLSPAAARSYKIKSGSY